MRFTVTFSQRRNIVSYDDVPLWQFAIDPHEGKGIILPIPPRLIRDMVSELQPVITFQRIREV